MKISRLPDLPKAIVTPNLELGQKYKLQVRPEDRRKPNKKKNARLIYLDEKIAVFDNGLYRDCQMIKNYKQDWEVKRA